MLAIVRASWPEIGKPVNMMSPAKTGGHSTMAMAFGVPAQIQTQSLGLGLLNAWVVPLALCSPGCRHAGLVP